MLSFLLWAMVLAQTPVQPALPPPADGLIAGRVIDGATGRPVTGVIVTLTVRLPPNTPPPPRDSTPPPPRVLVDATGRFIFAALRAGSYDLTATRRGYVTGQFGQLRAEGTGLPFTLAPGERRADLVVRVWKFASMGGTVLDEMNDPIVGVTVYALRREVVGGELRLTMAGTGATTDDRGAYRLGGLFPGDYLISVPSTTDTLPVAALNAYHAGTAAPQELRTAVTQVTSSPLALGDRDVVRVGNLVLHGRARGVVTPDPTPEGRLLIYPTTYAPEAPGPAATTPLISLAAGEARSVPPIRLRLTSAVRVSGLITGLAGATAPTTLILAPMAVDGFASESGFEAARTMADPSGAFTFLGVTPGTYRLRATTAAAPVPPREVAAPGSVPPPMTTFWMTEVITVDARDMTVTLAARPSLSVSGRLVFEGQRAQPSAQQIARDVVVLTAADGRQVRNMPGRDLGAEPGQFVIRDVAGGRYVVRPSATPSGWSIKSITFRGQDVIDTPIDVMDDVTDVVVTYTDRPTVLRGTARTSAGTVDAEATVIVFGTNPQRWVNAGRTPMRVRTLRADVTGTFEIRGLPPGEYFVAAIHDATAGHWQSAKTMTEFSRVATRIQLVDGATLTQDLRRIEK